jgi:hypothetical protein
MLLKNWLAGWRGLTTGNWSRRRQPVGRLFETLEPRYVLAEDFGDAPDDYQTLLANGGPQHTIVAGLFLGTRVDGEADATPNPRANGDDSTPSIGPNDEDGVANPQADFLLTTGTQPTITLRATNTTGTDATLFGWIDFDDNGEFGIASERAQATVPTGTANGTFTLTFPVVPAGFTGTTYARFRLSTGAAAQAPTGAAPNGEVEDYAVTITGPSSGTVKTGGTTKLASGATNMPTLADSDSFGTSVANVGDLDGDGVTDMAVGASGDDTNGTDRGAAHILFLNANGTVKSSTKIASGTGGGPTLANEDFFGISVANVGDLDGDGVADLAVGATGDDTNGTDRGAVHILFLNASGTVKSSTKIASGTGGGPTLANDDLFGISVANVGDLDGDGVADLTVGARGDDTGGTDRGAVHILFLNASGTVKSSTKIASGTGGGPTLADYDLFGSSVANVGDLDGDGVADLAVGARGDGANRGAVHILFLNASGTVKSSTKIASGTGGGPALANFDRFGISVANVGDLDGDGVTDLAVGAFGDGTGGASRGAVHILFLNAGGAVKSSTKIASGTGGGPTLANSDLFGHSVANVGDLDGDGVTDLAVGASRDDTGGTDTDRGAVYILRLMNAVPNTAPTLDASGNPFAILGVGSRQSTEMRQGTLVSDILARGAGGNPIADPDAAQQRGIAITAADNTLGSFQFTLVTNNPAESDWADVGTTSTTSALLLPDTARVRFNTGLIPHHAAAAPFLPLESKLDAGLTFRAWDQTTGTVGTKANTSTNGGSSAFSTATETSKVYFEARLFRVFNTVAGLNVYSLEAEFNALTANPALVDRSTGGFTGFTILMSAVPELGTAPLFRMYFGVQFNDDGTETDMGYRYLTSNSGEADILEGLGRADLRPKRQGAYFREIGDPAIPGDRGVNNGTAVLGYIYATQQPGTAQMTQVYRTDNVGKPTRPPGTTEGSTPTSTRQQEQGDHVYTTNTQFETGRPGTWRVESNRGFVRELTPNPTGIGSALSAASALSPAVRAESIPPALALPAAMSTTVAPDESVGITPSLGLIAIPAPTPVRGAAVPEGTNDNEAVFSAVEIESQPTLDADDVIRNDGVFEDTHPLAECLFGI